MTEIVCLGIMVADIVGKPLRHWRAKLTEEDININLAEQCQGKAGGAVGYKGKPGIVTIARLLRLKGEYVMQIGVGESLPITNKIIKNIKWGQTWPHIAVKLGVRQKFLVEKAGANHYSLTLGNKIKELEYFCQSAGILTERVDREN